MSAFTIFTAGLACLAPFVSAYHPPTGDSPVGNPIVLPGAGTIVPVGQDYNVTWTPTTDGTVSLVLLKGPANSLQVVGPIAEGIANTGSFTWNPSIDLQPGSTSTTGYGIQLIVDATGQYQYTTQFGISNSYGGDHGSWSSASWGTSTATASWSSSDPLVGYQSSSWTTDASSTSTAVDSSSTTVAIMTSWSNSTSSIPITTASATTASLTMATSTVSASLSTSSVTLSSTTSSSTTSAPAASSTGGAATLKSSVVGLLAVAAVAVFAL